MKYYNEDVRINIRNAEDAEWLYRINKIHKSFKHKNSIVTMSDTDYEAYMEGEFDNDYFSLR